MRGRTVQGVAVLVFRARKVAAVLTHKGLGKQHVEFYKIQTGIIFTLQRHQARGCKSYDRKAIGHAITSVAEAAAFNTKRTGRVELRAGRDNGEKNENGRGSKEAQAGMN